MNERNINMNYDASGACKKDPIDLDRSARGNRRLYDDDKF